MSGRVRLYFLVDIYRRDRRSARDKGEITALALKILDRLEIFARDALVVPQQSAVEVGADKDIFKFFHFISKGS